MMLFQGLIKARVDHDLPNQSFKYVILKWIDPFFRWMKSEHVTFHLQYKHSGTCANLKNCLTPKPENVRSHSSNSIENKTPL